MDGQDHEICECCKDYSQVLKGRMHGQTLATGQVAAQIGAQSTKPEDTPPTHMVHGRWRVQGMLYHMQCEGDAGIIAALSSFAAGQALKTEKQTLGTAVNAGARPCTLRGIEVLLPSRCSVHAVTAPWVPQGCWHSKAEIKQTAQAQNTSVCACTHKTLVPARQHRVP